MRTLRSAALLCVVFGFAGLIAAEPIRIGVFDVDASPPIGSPLAYDPTDGIEIPLSCRGMVLLSDQQPIILCAVDWIGIGNGGQREFKEALATAVGSVPSRVAVHVLHQHDAPSCDFTADQLLAQYGINSRFYDSVFARDVIRRAAEAASGAKAKAQRITHLGLGEGTVENVASNRRILGQDGKVEHIRWTATADPKIRAAPIGTIDPKLKMVSFWNNDMCVAALTYYATHPQSYYRTGLANPDFPGIARNSRQEETGVPHIHFNGAGGNIGAGKWNDGAKENRQILARRVAAGMKQAWEATRRQAVAATDLGWAKYDVVLPPGKHLNEASLQSTLEDRTANPVEQQAAARNLVWLRRCQSGSPIQLSCLRIGPARVLHMPGELFVEYQLAAQKRRSDLFVAMAAYGDYAPGYIGTKIAYSQGGYETSQRASRVAPEVETVLMSAITELLQ